MVLERRRQKQKQQRKVKAVHAKKKPTRTSTVPSKAQRSSKPAAAKSRRSVATKPRQAKPVARTSKAPKRPAPSKVAVSKVAKRPAGPSKAQKCNVKAKAAAKAKAKMRPVARTKPAPKATAAPQGKRINRKSRASTSEPEASPLKLTKESLAAHEKEHGSDVKKSRRKLDIDVESIITMELNKRQNPLGSAPVHSRFAMSPTCPASYAAPFSFSELDAAPRRSQSQASAPPKSWGAPRREVPSKPTTKPFAGRPSIASSVGDNLDDLLPSGDKLRLSANVPKECFNRAQKRRLSASRDLRQKAGLEPLSPEVAPRPPASPSRNTSQDAAQRSNAAPPCSPARKLSRASSWAPAPQNVHDGCVAAPGTPSGATAERMDEAMQVAARILDVRKQRFASKAEWGFAVLDKPPRDVVSVQKAYRKLMRPLHPDRAGSLPEVQAAVDLLREATDYCERALRQRNPPFRPTGMSFKHLCTQPGRRQFRVTWRAPENKDTAPVHRYIVAVFDPSYGKALSVGTLEPDYSQELGRYLAHDDPDLCCYTVSEEDLRKMPNLFKSTAITVQVAAGNNEGQSDWSIVRVPVSGASKSSAAPPPAPAQPKPVRTSSVPSAAPATARPSVGPRKSIAEDGGFDRYIDKKNGAELKSWLQHQTKEAMQAWLKKRFQQASGSKEVMIQRIISLKEGNPW